MATVIRYTPQTKMYWVLLGHIISVSVANYIVHSDTVLDSEYGEVGHCVKL